MKFNEKSKIKDVLGSALGKDILSKLLMTFDKDIKMVDNALVRNLPLSMLKRVVNESFYKALLELLNINADETIDYDVKGENKWWKEAVFYQIYPSSFCDKNNDGIGDIKGIISKLDYLKNLGVDAIWLSPIYDSPLADNGYDIRDYKKILSTFGTMEDFDELLKEIHQRDMKLIMDLVVNHISDEHEFYKEYLKGNEEYQDYFIRSKKKNNWTSWFSNDAWNYVKEKDEYVLHLFSPKQIDLNFENPKVREEVIDIIKFWLDKGIDGFRMDVINLISKASLEDGDETVYQMMGFRGVEKYFYGPRLHEYLKEMKEKAFAPYDAFSVGEMPGIGLEVSKLITHPSRKELDCVFNFDVLETPGHARFDVYNYDLHYLKKYFSEWMEKYAKTNQMAIFLENHDNPRMISKINDDLKYRDYIAKLLATLILTLKGTPFIYQGQELGLINPGFKNLDELKDIESINKYHELGANEEALKRVLYGSRDNARTPMPFDSDAKTNYGFSRVTPWIKCNEDALIYNAQNEIENELSPFNYYKNLIKLRKENLDSFIYSDFELIDSDYDTFIYRRKNFIIELNLSNKKAYKRYKDKIIMSNYDDECDYLRPYEANIIKM